MKQKTFLGFAFVAIAFALGGVSQPSFGQGATDDPLLTPILAELATQQALIVDNQAKIDAKLAVVAEDVRVARIFVSRGGGKVIGK